jgi:hypothetical protein
MIGITKGSDSINIPKVSKAVPGVYAFRTNIHSNKKIDVVFKVPNTGNSFKVIYLNNLNPYGDL